jgi:hypothetical protein
VLDVDVAALTEALGSESEPNPQPGQTLLNSVVEVSLDALAIGVTSSEHAARQPRREYSRQRLQQSTGLLADERHGGRRGLLRREAHPGTRSVAAIGEQTVPGPPSSSSINTSTEVMPGERIALKPVPD